MHANAARRVLVVDDDPKILKAVAQALRQEGFEPVCAATGEEGLGMCESYRPDLVILDIMLPGLDGFEVCGRLRSHGRTPILILSARGDELDKAVGFHLGADDYMTKPFSLSELVLRVRAILRRAQASPQSPEGDLVRLRDLEVNRATRSVLMRGRPVDLTRREFELLWLLATHPQHVFTREALLERVWHSTYANDQAAVTVCIRRLREKIELQPDHPEYIKTVWGIGYKLEA